MPTRIVMLCVLVVGCAESSQLTAAMRTVNALGQTLVIVDARLAVKHRSDRAVAGYGDEIIADNAQADLVAALWRAHGLLRAGVGVWRGGRDMSLWWRHEATCTAIVVEQLAATDVDPEWRDALGTVATTLRATTLDPPVSFEWIMPLLVVVAPAVAVRIAQKRVVDPLPPEPQTVKARVAARSELSP